MVICDSTAESSSFQGGLYMCGNWQASRCSFLFVCSAAAWQKTCFLNPWIAYQTIHLARETSFAVSRWEPMNVLITWGTVLSPSRLSCHVVPCLHCIFEYIHLLQTMWMRYIVYGAQSHERIQVIIRCPKSFHFRVTTLRLLARV